MLKTYKFRLYPTKRQVETFENWLDLCRELYNAALQERRDAWLLNRVSISYPEQNKQLTEIRKIRADVGELSSHVCQDQLRRLDKAFKAFFSRAQKGEKAGFPRFKSKNRFDSFTFPDLGGTRIIGNKLQLSKIGKVKIKQHREIEGKIKTVTIKRECGKWFAFFAVECEIKPLPETSEQIGVDVGIRNFAALSNGEQIENPRYFESAQKRLRIAQRKVARREKGGNRRRKAVEQLRKIHARIKNQRADFQHKESRKIVNCFGLIAVEDLNILGLTRSRLSKQINDAGWSGFLDKLAYKAEDAGRVFVKVNPRSTSQNCSGCGAKVSKPLSQRTHKCDSCGLVMDRDENAAINILRLGSSLQAQTKAVRLCVA